MFLSIFMFVFTLVTTVTPAMPEQIITKETRSWVQSTCLEEKCELIN